MAPIIGTITSVAGVIVGAKYISNQIKDIIGTAEAVVQNILQQIKQDLDELINNLEETYQDNLNITLGQLDNFTQNKLREIVDTFDTINEGIQEDITLITEGVRDTIQQASFELENSLKKTAVIAGETAVYVVDKTTNNLIVIISFVVLGVGLLAFPWLLLKNALPEGLSKILILAFMGLFLLLFGAIALFPRFRTHLISFTGLGLKSRIDITDLSTDPKIINHTPSVVKLEEHTELKILGVNLVQEGKELTASLDDKTVRVKASSYDTIVIDLTGFDVPDFQGSYSLVLLYDGVGTVQEVVEITKPQPLSNLYISGFTFSPSQPEEGKQVEALIKVKIMGRALPLKISRLLGGQMPVATSPK